MNEQIQAIQNFESFIKPLRVVFAVERTFSLNAFIVRQRYFIHGNEFRKLKYIPKIVFVCVERLRKLLKNAIDYELDGSLNEISNNFVNQIIKNAQNK